MNRLRLLLLLLLLLWPLTLDAANVKNIPVLATDVPAAGQVPVWNTAGYTLWETPKSSSNLPAADNYPLMDENGAFVWESKAYLAAALPACDATTVNWHVTVTDGFTTNSCLLGGGINRTDCVCDGTTWIPAGGGIGASNSTLQSAYDNSSISREIPTVISGPGGMRMTGFNSYTKAQSQCNGSEWQCRYQWIDESGIAFDIMAHPVDFVFKLATGNTFTITDHNDATVFQVTESGVASSAGAVTVLNKSTADVSIASSVTETLLYSVTIPANTLGTSGCVEVKLAGYGVNNVGTTQTFAMRMKYGASFGSSVANGQSTGAVNRYSDFVGRVCGNGTTGTQVINYNWTLSGTSSASYGTISENSTTSLVLGVWLTLSTNNAAMTFFHDHGIAVVMP